jgi:hypothetical protein
MDQGEQLRRQNRCNPILRISTKSLQSYPQNRQLQHHTDAAAESPGDNKWSETTSSWPSVVSRPKFRSHVQAYEFPAAGDHHQADERYYSA